MLMEEGLAPIAIPSRVWEREDTRRVLTSRDIAGLLRIAQQHTGASQHRIAIAVGMSQGRVNELMNKRRRVTTLAGDRG